MPVTATAGVAAVACGATAAQRVPSQARAKTSTAPSGAMRISLKAFGSPRSRREVVVEDSTTVSGPSAAVVVGGGAGRLRAGLPRRLGHVADMEMAGQHQPHALPGEGGQRPGGAADRPRLGVGPRRQEGVVGDDDAGEAGRQRRQPRLAAGQAVAADPAARPVGVPAAAPRGVQPDHADPGILEDRLGLRRDVPAPAGIGVEVALRQPIGDQVVVARHRQHRRPQPVEEGPGGEEFPGPAAHGQVAADGDQVGRVARQLRGQGGDDLRQLGAEMQVGQVGDAVGGRALAGSP